MCHFCHHWEQLGSEKESLCQNINIYQDERLYNSKNKQTKRSQVLFNWEKQTNKHPPPKNQNKPTTKPLKQKKC